MLTTFNRKPWCIGRSLNSLCEQPMILLSRGHNTLQVWIPQKFTRSSSFCNTEIFLLSKILKPSNATSVKLFSEQHIDLSFTEIRSKVTNFCGSLPMCICLYLWDRVLTDFKQNDRCYHINKKNYTHLQHTIFQQEILHRHMRNDVEHPIWQPKI